MQPHSDGGDCALVTYSESKAQTSLMMSKSFEIAKESRGLCTVMAQIVPWIIYSTSSLVASGW